MTNAFLSGPPFNLDAEAKTWVRSAFEALTPIQRLSQLFVLRSGVDSAAFERIERLRTRRDHGRIRRSTRKPSSRTSRRYGRPPRCHRSSRPISKAAG